MSIPGYNLYTLPNATGDQQNLLKNIFGMLSNTSQYRNQLGSLAQGDSDSIRKFQEPALRRFQEEILPQLREQFGSMGAQQSSGFTEMLGKLGNDLTSDLSSQGSQLQLQALTQLLGLDQNLINTALNAQPEKQYMQEQENPWWQSLLSPILGTAGGAVTGGLTGGPWGALAGGLTGLSNSLSGSGKGNFDWSSLK